jgi:ribosomal protein S18 acetylase RimI-like enzyme
MQRTVEMGPEFDTRELARRLEQSVSLAAAPGFEAVRSGPFRAFFDPDTAFHQLNYAMPVAPLGSAEELAGALAGLRQLFHGRGRRLRVEFVGQLWPELPAALARAGLELENDEPLMACTPQSFAPVEALGVAVRSLHPDDPDVELASYIRIRDESDAQPEPHVVARLREQLARGNAVFALANLSGEPAGTGRCISGDGGLGELVAIVTRCDLRRRGVAGTVVSFLLRRHFDRGGTLAWLSAANDGAASVYGRLGFRSIGSLLNYEEVASSMETAAEEGGSAGEAR